MNLILQPKFEEPSIDAEEKTIGYYRFLDQAINTLNQNGYLSLQDSPTDHVYCLDVLVQGSENLTYVDIYPLNDKITPDRISLSQPKPMENSTWIEQVKFGKDDISFRLVNETGKDSILYTFYSQSKE
jgi:hypothetical protein|tara:strand:- start:2560 stop:2943 length:384 start_codon:yes stop_codon:yes gene_type:complete